jgi:UDP-N-acetylglucosamine 2-epimerase (non-hydrolysing)/GDP/UDP-N,N'-diacetylbacillosamine 2-epimerase (hydrolysing)
VTRKIVSVTGSRADYGVMETVHRAIAGDPAFDLHLIVTAMHFLPAFASSLAEVRKDRIGTLHELQTIDGGDGGGAMAAAVGRAVVGMSGILTDIEPDILLLQGDRGEMLAAAIAAVHMNIPVVHMSGGDVSGSVDDAVRNAISKLASFHLTNCMQSSERLVAMGETRARIVEVGDPAVDQLRRVDFAPLDALAKEFDIPAGRPFLVATLHPVTDEADRAARQMETLLDALEEVGLVTVFTHPNADSGGGAMRETLEAARGRPLLRIVPNLGSRRYLSLLRHAAAIVGNSSSGLYDTPTLKIPAVNIGSRQTGRVRADNVVDVDFDRAAIVRTIRFVLNDAGYRAKLAQCRNPYGDGHAAERTVEVLKRLVLGAALTAKWRNAAGPFLTAASDAA